MSVTLEEVQKYVGKDAVVHFKQNDGSLREAIVTIKAATVAGIPYKEKGKSPLQLATIVDIEEIAPAPVKEKAVTQRVVKPLELGQARQHLIDRHGVALSWAKDATEQAAFEWHETLDHADLGHRHEVKEKDEREQALAQS